MKLQDVVILTGAKVICGEEKLDREVEFAFASDLMSDVLTLDVNNLLLITGLANLQAIRTAEMSDIQCILFVRRKKVSEEMELLARENNMILLEAETSMFKAAGLLYAAGIKPMF